MRAEYSDVSILTTLFVGVAVRAVALAVWTLMSKIKELALSHKLAGDELRSFTLGAVSRVWRRIDPKRLADSFYSDVHPGLVRYVSEAQYVAASYADEYTSEITGVDSVGRLNPEAFSGIAADGRDLDTLLEQPLGAALDAYYAGDTTTAFRESNARRAGLASLERITASEVSDAGRTADGVAIASRPSVQGYTRVLELPSCSRCVLLAGRVYRALEPFRRHERCDCKHLPLTDVASIPGDVLTDPEAAIKAGMVRGLSQADTQAVLDGADPAQVINARRGMTNAADGTKLTTEDTSRKGLAGMRRGKGKPRLRPESIYRLASDRDEAIQMLRAHAYIV